ncbi:hypothetical protein LTR84_012700 [Exophiala bonariae]|uniref:Uncharacterized protein n=1 Tax=Exophiala bonariae TaxID=1690606 RepID=A0AAV9NF34_9EURO|nr:hypothetical protein LTR84_012700 [Exophiala bonariae]
MVVTPGGWRGTFSDFYAPQTTNARLFSFHSDRDDVEELPLESLSLASASSPLQENNRAPRCVPAASEILVLEATGEKFDHESSASSQVTAELFDSVCSTWRISPLVKERISRPGSLPRFEYEYDERQQLQGDENMNDGQTSRAGNEKLRMKAIDIGFQWGPGHGTFIVACGKYDFDTRALHMFVSWRGIFSCYGFSSPPNPPDQCDLLNLPCIATLMTRHRTDLATHPLNFVGLLMSCCERYIDIRSQQYNLAMLRIGTAMDALSPSEFTEWFRSWNAVSTAVSRENTMLFDCYNDVTWSEKTCLELTGIARRYLSVVEAVERRYGPHGRDLMPRDIVHSVVYRTEMHGHLLRYVDKMITMQFNFQSNNLVQKDAQVSIQISSATREDGRSMKTLAYLTLFFLPITFVCAIFSTTIFNFENWHVDNRNVVSSGWWVFVVSCVAAMIGTTSAWFVLIVRQHDQG